MCLKGPYSNAEGVSEGLQKIFGKFSKIREWTLDIIEKLWGICRCVGILEELPWMPLKELLKNSVDFVWVWWSFRLWRDPFNGFQAFSGRSFMGLGFQVLQSYGDLSGAPRRGKFNGISERNCVGTWGHRGITEGFLGNLHKHLKNLRKSLGTSSKFVGHNMWKHSF